MLNLESVRNMPCKLLPAAVQLAAYVAASSCLLLRLLAADVQHPCAEPRQRAQHRHKLLPCAVQQLRVRNDESSCAALVESRLPHRRQRIACADEVGSSKRLGCLRGQSRQPKWQAMISRCLSLQQVRNK